MDLGATCQCTSACSPCRQCAMCPLPVICSGVTAFWIIWLPAVMSCLLMVFCKSQARPSMAARLWSRRVRPCLPARQARRKELGEGAEILAVRARARARVRRVAHRLCHQRAPEQEVAALPQPHPRKIFRRRSKRRQWSPRTERRKRPRSVQVKALCHPRRERARAKDHHLQARVRHRRLKVARAASKVGRHHLQVGRARADHHHLELPRAAAKVGPQHPKGKEVHQAEKVVARARQHRQSPA
mmetsp:Transcript_37596/g.65573  ORF Transcript_37596/g.65573 Transcript_37596/m.65573 type:complete len:243 (+) Transcript_37596:815-1543(+)